MRSTLEKQLDDLNAVARYKEADPKKKAADTARGAAQGSRDQLKGKV